MGVVSKTDYKALFEYYLKLPKDQRSLKKVAEDFNINYSSLKSYASKDKWTEKVKIIEEMEKKKIQEKTLEEIYKSTENLHGLINSVMENLKPEEIEIKNINDLLKLTESLNKIQNIFQNIMGTKQETKKIENTITIVDKRQEIIDKIYSSGLLEIDENDYEIKDVGNYYEEYSEEESDDLI